MKKVTASEVLNLVRNEGFEKKSKKLKDPMGPLEATLFLQKIIP